MLFFTMCVWIFISLFCDCAISLNCSCSFDGVGRVRCLPICNETKLLFEHFVPPIRSLHTYKHTENAVFYVRKLLLLAYQTSPQTTPQYRSMQYGQKQVGAIYGDSRFRSFFFHFPICSTFFSLLLTSNDSINGFACEI